MQNRLANSWCLALAGLFLAGSLAVAAEPSQTSDELVLRVYPVADLLMPAPDYPYQGQTLPTTKALRAPEAPKALSSGQGGGGTGMGGGGMGSGMGMGGGMFQVPAEAANTDTNISIDSPISDNAAISTAGQPTPANPTHPPHDSTPCGIDRLIQVITAFVEPPTWDTTGGEGSITSYGTQLLISQTPAVHEKLQHFLQMMRAESAPGQSLVVEAAWLQLDSLQLEKLLTGSASSGWATAIDPGIFENTVRSVPSFRGQLTCFNRQTVHLISGNRRLVIIGQTPVVGGPVGYQPIVALPNLGVLLQVTPSLVPSTGQVSLDLHSTVTEWRKPDPALALNVEYPPTTQTEPDGVTMAHAGGRSTAEVDRLNILTQELETSVRIPLDRPVLIGGLTRDPASDAPEKQDRTQLYLVVRVRPIEVPPSK